eukprot:4079944-Amphidinium_carterae.1
MSDRNAGIRLVVTYYLWRSPFTAILCLNNAGVQCEALEALRDASMILGGERPYREMPEWWVSNQLDSLGLEVEQKQASPDMKS